MDDAMIDLLAGDATLRRRLEAYADARLSPELAATTRMRARVLAVAHRQAALIRADGALAVVSDAPGAVPDPADSAAVPARSDARATARRGGRGHAATRRAATMGLAACLCLSLAVGGALAARPGGALYGARVWAETLTLPMAPRERAVAELSRLQARLIEARSAASAGDPEAVAAALVAYESILGTASSEALAGGDAVALAALETGVGHNIDVLTALLDQVPAAARPALERVVEQAVARSESTVRDIRSRPVQSGSGGGGSGGKGGAGGGTGSGGGQGPAATDAPTPAPTATPTKTPKPDPTPRPTRTPRATEDPAPEHTPEPTPRPTRTPRPPAEERDASQGSPDDDEP